MDSLISGVSGDLIDDRNPQSGMPKLPDVETRRRPKWLTFAVALWLGIVSGVIVRLILVRLFAGGPNLNEDAMFANFFLATVPFLGIFLAWLRRIPARMAVILVAITAVFALAVNLSPLIPGYQRAYSPMENVAQTGTLTAMHLPVVLWLLVGVAFTARRGWRDADNRMDFIRFSGEWVVYLVLTWLLGGAILALLLAAVSISGAPLFVGDGLSTILAILAPLWLLISLWMTEQTRSLVARLLSVLSWVFTPIMCLALVIVFGVFIANGTFTSANRDLLVLLDFMLLLVLGLVLYSVAARNPNRLPGAADWVQFVMIALAVLMNLIALIWMLVRLAEFGWTANRAAALGLNLILMANLAGTGWLFLKFFRQGKVIEAAADENYTDADYYYGDEAPDAVLPTGHPTVFHQIINWQTQFLVVYLAWAAFVVLVFPLIFTIRW